MSVRKRTLSLLLTIVMVLGMLPFNAMAANDEPHEGKKVEIAFVIDTTSSMSEEIARVKSNVSEFARYLESQGVTLRMSVVEYRDITVDGPGSTIVHTVNHSPWHTSAAQLEETLASLSVSGGGDASETLIDALACLTETTGEDQDKVMRWSSDAYKFAFVLTDAGYKNDNAHGIRDMEQMISVLNAKGISASVITTAKYQSTYKDLVEKTGGEFADINSSDFATSLKKLADNALSLTVKAESVDVVVKAIKQDSSATNIDNVTDADTVVVEGAIVSVFLQDEVRYYTTDERGVAHIPLEGLTDEQIHNATVSAHKAWSVGVTDPLTNNRWYLQRLTTDERGLPQRFIYELHSERIDSNGNWYGESLSAVVNGRSNEFVLHEPRMLINLSVCYFEPSSESASANANREAVKRFMGDLSKSIAQTTDGHVMINKVLIGKTDERTDFFVPATKKQIPTETSDIIFKSVPDYDSATLASMADIKLETSESENVKIHSNAYPLGYYENGIVEYAIDSSISDRFVNLSVEEQANIDRRNYEFRRIQES